MSNLRHTLHTLFKQTVETVTPPLTKSQFEEKRVLTPDEFVAAGDYLVHACPTWSWEGGDPKKRRTYFPPNKQFLVTRNVPCLKRATELEGYNPNSEFDVGGGEGEDAWVATHSNPAAASGSAGKGEVPSIDGAGAGGSGGAGAAGGNKDDDIPDITDLELNEADDEAAAPSGRPYLRAEEPADNIMRTRTYDLYITYDQYYQVPRFWLVGHDESRKPLLPQQVMEDVSEEHARKTITVDPHPHLAGLSAASIHPCRHADVMKKLVDNLLEAGREFKVEQYLVLFLKFIASVVPTIQYDYTMSVGGE
ncbi:hypothetical protein CHLRE_02g102350v5 [Chlamydomonas reinhardtii]|uniref:Autophagy-related protein 3 n=1 Tax=Chlamydomonas reinhardtii TaxID=3055 RepID=A8I4N9_CHLRE|nr:uncharacterized protein CHLRE_02g102350v5 [Chlamydomonas reinhardtii]PNW86945.1 hypothetical protein CHLRE_02g102350v5 [Chlamydomonas reinhardtii]|eukprot:XP_001699795.1 autophagy protein [Chlamydomonas reinhardtii]